MRCKIMDAEKKKFLIDTLEIMGVDYEHPSGSQFLRDHFPDGVPADIAIEGVRLKNEGKELLELSALQMLSMVPVHGIEDELLYRLQNNRNKVPQDKESFSFRFRLSQALRYLDHPEGLKEFETLREIMKTYPKDDEPVWLYAFIEFERDLAKWKRDRAAGKRWEMFEDDD
jgi:hypothetical protein